MITVQKRNGRTERLDISKIQKHTISATKDGSNIIIHNKLCPKFNENLENSKIVFVKISKLHGKTFQEHLTTPPNSSS